MGAVPAKCLTCQRDLRYDPVSLRCRCPVCDTRAVPEDVWRRRGEHWGRRTARLLYRFERWLGKWSISR